MGVPFPQYAVKVLNKKTLQTLQFGNQNLLKSVEKEIQIMRLLVLCFPCFTGTKVQMMTYC
jgi:hypothetical protein